MAKTLEDDDGNKSSKRLGAFILIGAAVTIGIGASATAVFRHIADHTMIVSIVETFAYGGVGVLLGTLVDKFIKKRPNV